VQQQARLFKFGRVRASSCSNAVQAEVEEALMESPHYLTFGSFRLDVTHGRLWQGEQPITLRPRSLAVLQYLVEHPGRLVTKAELRGQVWAGTHVTDIVLRVSIREIRAALGDSATTPCYVETIGQQGYRFLGGEPALPPPLTTGPLVGRQREVAILGAVVPVCRQRPSPARLREW
jgi:DNA-binding winged helix-turn-helix (wHTH) protein